METIEQRKQLYAGPILTLSELTVRLPDGTTAPRILVHTTGAAGVLALKQGRALFVRQWRTPLGQETLEVPAGKIEPGETPLQAAKRELNEEAQLAAEHWQPLTHFYQSAGFSDAQTHLFLAEDFHAPAQQRPQDVGESVQGELLSLQEAQAAQQAGLICDAKTTLAVALWALEEAKHG